MRHLNLFSRLDRWLLQWRSSCKITPKYLTCLFSLIFCPLIRKFSHIVIFLFLGLKIIILVLFTFIESLFARIHSFASFRPLLICLLNFLKEQSERRRFVSSANWCTALNWNHLSKLLTKENVIQNLVEDHNQSSFNRILFLELLYIVFYLLKMI